MHLKTDTQTAQAHFSQVPTISHGRNAFTIAEKHVSTVQFDNLYPMYWKYIYPGDTLSITVAFLARLQTQIAPLYDDLYIDLHAWYVPFRLLQTNWARFQFNAQPGGPSQDNSSLTTPNIDLVGLGSGGFAAKSLYDYLGFPTAINMSGSPANQQWINNYIGRAYNLIFNDNYADENLVSPAVVDLDEGPDSAADYVILTRGKRHDRFTSCLPFQQKGTAATLPLGTSAAVKLTSTFPADATVWRNSGTGATLTGAFTVGAGGVSAVGGTAALADPGTALYADLSTATAATVNALRQSVAVQHLLEADARGGTRDVEAIQHRWGVTVPDFRLQRPEYIGGTTLTFDAHIVPQTSETATTPQATLTQFSQAMQQFNLTHSFVEHGVFMVLASARSNITYQQGLLRELSYQTRYDFYQPEFANLGEVAVKNKEIYMGSSNISSWDGTFGYQEYGYELRYSLNRVTAEMRSNYSTSLDSRHMADDYGSAPTLSAGWIASNTPISRNIAVNTSTADPIQFNFYTSGKIARTLPMYSIPGLNRL